MLLEVPEVLFACVVVMALPARAWRRHRKGAPPAPAGRYLLETLLLIGALVWLLWRRHVPLSALGLQGTSPLRFLGDVAVCLIAIVGLDVWEVWRITRRLRHAAVIPAASGTFADARAGGRTLASFAVVTSVGAIWEELCFRATVLLLVPHTPAGIGLGIVGGSLAFGAQHLRNGRAAMAYAGFYGVLFSVLYLLTGNLIAVMVAHAAGNILTVAQWAPRIERARRQAMPRAPIFLG